MTVRLIIIILVFSYANIAFADTISNNYNNGLIAMENEDLASAKRYFTKVYDMTEEVASHFKRIYPDDERTIYNAMARYKLGVIHLKLSKNGVDKSNYNTGMKFLEISCERGYQPSCEVMGRIKRAELGLRLNSLMKNSKK